MTSVDFEPAAAVKQMDEVLNGWKAKTPYQRIERPAVPGVQGDRIVIETPDKANAVYMAGLMRPLTDADPRRASDRSLPAGTPL